MAQVTEHLLCKLKALRSNPSPTDRHTHTHTHTHTQYKTILKVLKFYLKVNLLLEIEISPTFLALTFFLTINMF
jgi:hypothetical protein